MINSVIEVAVQHGFTHASVLHLINVLVVALLINVLLGFICMSINFSKNIPWMCCCTLTFRILHLIGILNGLGNFKLKIFYLTKCKIFLHFKATDPMYLILGIVSTAKEL